MTTKQDASEGAGLGEAAVLAILHSRLFDLIPLRCLPQTWSLRISHGAAKSSPPPTICLILKTQRRCTRITWDESCRSQSVYLQ